MDVREKLVELCEDLETLPCCATYEEQAEYLISNGVTVWAWIPVTEPPKDTYEYWIAYKAGGDYFYSTGYFDGKCWRSAITHKQIPVTHWQYLPQPPKGE